MIVVAALLAGCNPDVPDPTETTDKSKDLPTETFATTPRDFPALALFSAAFGYDADAGQAMQVTRDGQPVPAALQITLGTTSWDLDPSSDQACEVFLDLDGLPAAAWATEDGWWLGLDLGEAPTGWHTCDAFDLTAFPEEDPVAWLSTDRFSGWAVAVGGELEGSVAAELETRGDDLESRFGAMLRASGLQTTSNVGRAFALEPGSDALVLVDDAEVPLLASEVPTDTGAVTAWYTVTHWFAYYLPRD